MPPERRPWTRDELILAINLYCKTPFGKIHIHNPKIIALAEKLGRTPGSVSYKLANFASIDPSLPRKGASNVSKLDKEVWNEYFNNWEEMAFQSEVLAGEAELTPKETAFPEGKTADGLVKTRVNQSFFRKMILASYNNTCCITGINIPELLTASHIIPWAASQEHRINPQNGLCLNALHDRAFDAGLITINENWQVIVSPQIEKHPPEAVKLITEFKNKKIQLPKRFQPSQEFLRWHREMVWRGGGKNSTTSEEKSDSQFC
ncbi:MAG: HNH endonuclease [Firmicutes bacterium]|nr:HNH endonuclease [Bacillota bacterium]